MREDARARPTATTYQHIHHSFAMQYTSYTHYLHTLPTYINFLAMKWTHDMRTSTFSPCTHPAHYLHAYINFFAMHPPYMDAHPTHYLHAYINFFAMQCNRTYTHYLHTYINFFAMQRTHDVRTSTFSPCTHHTSMRPPRTLPTCMRQLSRHAMARPSITITTTSTRY